MTAGTEEKEPFSPVDSIIFFWWIIFPSSNRSSKGSVNWKYMLKSNPGESSPVVCKDQVLVCTKTGIITILDANNGKLEWEYDTGEQITSSPAVIKDRFMILTTKGTLFCFGKK